MYRKVRKAFRLLRRAATSVDIISGGFAVGDVMTILRAAPNWSSTSVPAVKADTTVSPPVLEELPAGFNDFETRCSLSGDSNEESRATRGGAFACSEALGPNASPTFRTPSLKSPVPPVPPEGIENSPPHVLVDAAASIRAIGEAAPAATLVQSGVWEAAWGGGLENSIVSHPLSSTE